MGYTLARRALGQVDFEVGCVAFYTEIDRSVFECSIGTVPVVAWLLARLL